MSSFQIFKLLLNVAWRSFLGEPGLPAFPYRQVAGAILFFTALIFLFMAGCSLM